MTLIEFGPLSVHVDERVLRPREWTLLQSRWVAELEPSLPDGAIAELCSGAGHIGQAAASLSGRSIVQVDVDPHACDLAAANAERNNLAGRVEVRCGDLGKALRSGERFAAVLADPPYLPSSEVGVWPDDPLLAIDGGDDGLELLRRCIAVSQRHLEPGGVVLLQTAGRRQIDALAPDVEAAGLQCHEVREVDDDRAVGLLRARVR